MQTKKKIKRLKSRSKAKQGTLIIIGGREDKNETKKILTEVARRNDGGKLVVVTAASAIAEDIWNDYKLCFKSLGIKKIEHLHIEQPDDAHNPDVLKVLENAKTVFFTGGDQLKITTKIGGTEIMDQLLIILKKGGIIAGTSAGAAMMGEVMLIGGENNESHKVGNWMMAPGLGFVRNMIIDQHFAQRGRIGRLLGAVALNPGILGIGIDEDTAIVVENNVLKVIGNSAVYIVDGKRVTHTNISEASADKTMSMHNVLLHILGENEVFHLETRKINYAPEVQ
jgi:cyanophycinase